MIIRTLEKIITRANKQKNVKTPKLTKIKSNEVVRTIWDLEKEG
jgi:hypothetical protein